MGNGFEAVATEDVAEVNTDRASECTDAVSEACDDVAAVVITVECVLLDDVAVVRDVAVSEVVFGILVATVEKLVIAEECLVIDERLDFETKLVEEEKDFVDETDCCVI